MGTIAGQPSTPRVVREPPDPGAEVRRVLDTLGTLVCLMTPDGVVLDINEAPLRLTGLAREDVVGHALDELALWEHNPDTLEALRDGLARARAGDTVRFDAPLTLPGSRRVILEVQVATLRDAAGRVTHLVPSAVDVTERRRVDELRDTFIGMLSHELRTPITSLYAASQLLRRREAEAGASSRDLDLVDEVVAGTERLQRIVENLLVLAQVERGVALPGADPVLLQRILPGVLDGERRSWPGLRVEVADLPQDLPPVSSDADALVQVLRNLVSNAAKYGPPGGRVLVSVEVRSPDLVCLTVADEGPGLGGVDPERLFDVYYRAEDATRRAAGAGIGLFVSRALVEAMGGTLVAADRDGGGAAFTACLPVFSED